jgi:type IV pilus assembly protein PilE
MKPRHAGFNLIELMVTVAIVAIVAAVAVPSYRQYVIRAKRTDATGALLRLAANQERFYIQNNTYASQALMDDAPPAGLGIDGTERGFYDLTIAARGATLANGYTATATVAAGGDQADDDDCVEFSVNDQGLRTAGVAPGDASTTDLCWR